MANNFGMVAVLLGKGADPDRPVPVELARPELGMTTNPGERALHVAARSGKVEIVGLLLKRARADPNVTDNTGSTPLMETCRSLNVRVEVVRLLLEAGADPTLARIEDNWTPLHAAAVNGRVGLAHVLYAAAPATLNRCSSFGETPLCLACVGGHEGMVSKLLSLGAMEPPMPLVDDALSPLLVAVCKGFMGVVRILLEEEGFRAIGGRRALPDALYNAIRYRQTRILRLLLAAEGDEKRSELANTSIGGAHPLHFGAAFCCPAAVSILLEAGADEATRHPEGYTPRDVIGVGLGRDDQPQVDRQDEVAIGRMLQRGPAYRARAWAWPCDEEADAGGSGDGDTAAAAAAAAAAGLSPPPAVETPPVIGVRIF
ncbi:unnamed protein product, partial [Laminaria digitata]